MTYTDMERVLNSPEGRDRLKSLYNAEGAELDAQVRRYAALIERHRAAFNNEDGLCCISAPGRVELMGNHTDHNRGAVLAAAINRDTVACAAKRRDMRAVLHSEGYPPVDILLDDLAPRAEESGKTAALIRGVAAGMKKRGYRIGGFEACVASNVLGGSGMSSSAAFEVMLSAMMDHLYNGDRLTATPRAQIAQEAENEYFMKPSGLMDQLASSTGGLTMIDFEHEEPVVTPMGDPLCGAGLRVTVVATGGSHDDLTPEYAAIPREMGLAARALGHRYLRETDEDALFAAVHLVRREAGDRAVLRALHFFEENKRVFRAAKHLSSGDIPAFLTEVAASGVSSWTLLQNVSVPGDARFQPMALSQAAANRWLAGRGVSRVHGGGFAGTTLHILPETLTGDFVSYMDGVFGAGAAMPVSVRKEGAAVVF